MGHMDNAFFEPCPARVQSTDCCASTVECEFKIWIQMVADLMLVFYLIVFRKRDNPDRLYLINWSVNTIPFIVRDRNSRCLFYLSSSMPSHVWLWEREGELRIEKRGAQHCDAASNQVAQLLGEPFCSWSQQALNQFSLITVQALLTLKTKQIVAIVM